MLKETMDVYTLAASSADNASKTYAGTKTASNVRCQRQQLSAQRRYELGLPEMEDAFVLYWERGNVTLTNESRLLIGGTYFRIYMSEQSIDRRKPSKAYIHKDKLQTA